MRLPTADVIGSEERRVGKRVDLGRRCIIKNEKLKKSRPLPEATLSHATAWKANRDPTFCGSSRLTISRAIPSNSTPRVGSAQTLEVNENPVILVSGSDGATISVA